MLSALRILTVISAALPALALPSRAAEAPPEAVPSRSAVQAAEAVNFSLLDYRGKHFELRRTDAKLVVLFFTGFGCPIARQIVPKLRKMDREMAEKGVAFWLINAAPQDDPPDIAIQMLVRSKKNALTPESALDDIDAMRLEVLKAVVGTLPVLRDERQLVARHYGVTRTCEAIVIDPEHMKVVYRGAVDDQMTEGAQKPAPTANFLTDAITEYLAGKPVTTPTTGVHGCRITFEHEVPETPVSYSRQVAPILQKHCVACHSPGQIGPFAMTSGKKVKSWSAMIEEVLLDRRMPPWHADRHHGTFANDRTLTADETHTLFDWISQGSPLDDAPDPLATPAPPPATWALGPPDFIVPLPKRQEIPATGTLKYRYLDTEYVMPEDAWVRAAVCRPDNPQVVHHIIVRVLYPDGYKDAPKESYLFTTWVPGLMPSEMPAGTGMFVPKGSRFNFEMHYTTNGEEQTDLSEMGLYRSREKPGRELEVRACETRDFVIPPGVADSTHFAHYAFKKDTILYDLSPHMHLRGSWFKFELLLPDGKRETLLSVPQYDFNWQTSYRLAKPRRVPAGSWMLCTGGYDNSPQNPNNPDPAKTIRWGLQSWDEMFMGFMTVTDAGPETAE